MYIYQSHMTNQRSLVPMTESSPNIWETIMPKLIASWLKTPANPLRDVGAISINGTAPEFISLFLFCVNLFFKTIMYIAVIYIVKILYFRQYDCMTLLQWMLLLFFFFQTKKWSKISDIEFLHCCRKKNSSTF